jgi:hypothetical protein
MQNPTGGRDIERCVRLRFSTKVSDPGNRSRNDETSRGDRLSSNRSFILRRLSRAFLVNLLQKPVSERNGRISKP